MAITGALMTTCMPMAKAIWTWVTSFVERVMRLARENLPVSALEKAPTLSNCILRRRCESEAAMYAATAPTIIAARRLPNAAATMGHP